MNDLFELPKLSKILGYQDIRSTRAWCRKNNVPIIVLGRKSYINQQSIDNLVESQLFCSASSKDSSQSPIDAIRKNKQPLLIQAINPEVPASKRKEIKGHKNVHSVAANDLLNAVHSAK